ncbi:hypothetical protein KMW28_15440 [Flammeovirga yaeyamensis]|uniref:Uncharacterized protein n=1 Tax=Flammeovirga yaeyamensis TaxID=367791 RepID=A0AAX1N0I3_9BACT|nr:hypothetical protein [Flammeovirga yaeyamensis]MBB3698594.1 Leucine-rich repeat (LRR) protein [Flammeovirga yaeyamensis]NMF34057.1 hypothetical protein [Flammeovirga yaeyamensis]QWG01045.1 hypothetical protein KMW28_15440 [Flammeovirga yaeyamensis]
MPNRLKSIIGLLLFLLTICNSCTNSSNEEEVDPTEDSMATGNIDVIFSTNDEINYEDYEVILTNTDNSEQITDFTKAEDFSDRVTLNVGNYVLKYQPKDNKKLSFEPFTLSEVSFEVKESINATIEVPIVQISKSLKFIFDDNLYENLINPSITIISDNDKIDFEYNKMVYFTDEVLTIKTSCDLGVIYENEHVITSNDKEDYVVEFTNDVENASSYNPHPIHSYYTFTLGLSDKDLIVGLNEVFWSNKFNWSKDNTIENFNHVVVENDRVVEINITDVNVDSQLPGIFGYLPKLKKLTLRNIGLNTTDIPSTFIYLKDLELLDLSSNRISYIIDPIKNLNKLVYLDLSFNEFSGDALTVINSLNQLEYLNLSYNDFNGEIMNFLYENVNLTYLNLSGNNFSNRVSEEWFSGKFSDGLILDGKNYPLTDFNFEGNVSFEDELGNTVEGGNLIKSDENSFYISPIGSWGLDSGFFNSSNGGCQLEIFIYGDNIDIPEQHLNLGQYSNLVKRNPEKESTIDLEKREIIINYLISFDNGDTEFTSVFYY